MSEPAVLADDLAELRDERLLLAVSGSASAALVPSWLYLLRAHVGAQVRTVLTRAALQFVTPSAVRAVSGARPYVDADLETGVAVHQELAAWCTAVLVAPATANTVARLAAGLSDNLLGATVLDAEVPRIVAPSLSAPASRSPATRRNLRRLEADGFSVCPTTDGRRTTDGHVTPGAMPDAPTVLAFLAREIRAARGTDDPPIHHTGPFAVVTDPDRTRRWE